MTPLRIFFPLFILFALFIISPYLLHAHTVWITTTPHGKIGTAQEVKIFFGEFNHGDPTPAKRWFSDLPSLTLWVHYPDGRKANLPISADSICYKAIFTPQEKGNYSFWLAHEVKDTYKKMKITYTSVAMTSVGNTKEIISTEELPLQIKRKKQTLWIYKNNSPFTDSVKISTIKEPAHYVHMQQDGQLLPFEKKPQQSYLLEIPTIKKMQGASRHHQQPYTTDYTNFTYYIATP